MAERDYRKTILVLKYFKVESYEEIEVKIHSNVKMVMENGSKIKF